MYSRALTVLSIFFEDQTDDLDNGYSTFKQCCIRFILLFGRLYSYGFWLDYYGGDCARDHACIDKVIERFKIKTMKKIFIISVLIIFCSFWAPSFVSATDYAWSESPTGYYTFIQATDYCASLGDSWRVPSLSELYSEFRQNQNLNFIAGHYYFTTTVSAFYPTKNYQAFSNNVDSFTVIGTLRTAGGSNSYAKCIGTGAFLNLSIENASDLLDYTGSLFTDLWVIITLVIGLPLAFYIIRKVISLVRAR